MTIILPFYGQLEFTRLCIPRILSSTRQPYEVVCLDFDCVDGTPQYLDGVRVAAPVAIDRVHFPCDAPFAEAVHQVLQRAGGEFVLLLSPDTLVTDNWLAQLMALARMAPTIGMVSCVSNCAPPHQQCGGVPYLAPLLRELPKLSALPPAEVRRRLGPVDAFAREWREAHRGKWSEEEHLGGGVLLLRRGAWQSIKIHEVPSTLGWLDTLTLSRRLIQAGWRLACCRDLFIHHFGTRIAYPSLPPTG